MVPNSGLKINAQNTRDNRTFRASCPTETQRSDANESQDRRQVSWAEESIGPRVPNFRFGVHVCSTFTRQRDVQDVHNN